MRKRLPPLNALRAFECAAGCQSFTKAAEELHVTPSAISRHVSQLEAWLGLPLFTRRQRRIELTQIGREYAQSVGLAFDTLESATREAIAGTRPELRFKLAPTVAFRWLVPRVIHFHKSYPDVSIQISTSLDPVDLQAEESDLTVAASVEAPPGMQCTWLFDDELVPVCKPDYLPAGPGVAERMKRSTLLTSQSRRDDWSTWFAGAGIEPPTAAPTLEFQYSFLAYEAAREGGGIAIAVKSLVEEDLALGRLAMLHPTVVPKGTKYFLISRPEAHGKPAVRGFHEWAASHQTPRWV